MGAKYTVCCCRYYLRHSREEKNAILRMRKTKTSRPPEQLSSDSSDSSTEEESIFGPPLARRSPWRNQSQKNGCAGGGGGGGGGGSGGGGGGSSSTPEHPWAHVKTAGESPVRRGSDRELQAFISMRDQTDKATEEWEKLNYDIHTLRYTRREVRSRWKKILLQLGYQCEVDALLCVNRQSRLSRDQEHLNRATELLKQLLADSCLFPPGTGHQNKYLYVMDRLVTLDSAEDFVRLATEKYPKNEVEKKEDGEKKDKN